jgi:hypothetical protein
VYDLLPSSDTVMLHDRFYLDAATIISRENKLAISTAKTKILNLEYI